LSGFLENSELKDALLAVSGRSAVSDEEINEIVQQLDYNKNGKINFTDFLAATIDI